ncbi:MAG: hypothetical protein JWO78_1790 [Micavibrio sp.]|nr:hypothetical protein [Micavibrio sp.]
MAKLGGVYIPNLESSFEGAVTPSFAHYRETPSKVKFDYSAGDFGGFTIGQDEKIWGSDVYGIVAVSNAAFAALPADLQADTMDEARVMANVLNNPKPKSAITVKPAINQSRKF